MFCKSLATCIHFDMVGIPKSLSGSNYTKGDKKRKGRVPSHNHGSPNNDPISQGRESCEETQFRLVIIVVRGSTTAPKNHWTRSTQFKGRFAYLYVHILELLAFKCFTEFFDEPPLISKRMRPKSEDIQMSHEKKNFYFPLYWLVNVG